MDKLKSASGHYGSPSSKARELERQPHLPSTLSSEFCVLLTQLLVPLTQLRMLLTQIVMLLSQLLMLLAQLPVLLGGRLGPLSQV